MAADKQVINARLVHAAIIIIGMDRVYLATVTVDATVETFTGGLTD